MHPLNVVGGRDHLAIPGPSVIPDRVLRAMHRAAPNIYEGELVDVTLSTLTGLQEIAHTKAEIAVYHGNGHAGWEACLCNLLSAGDEILVVVTGRFGAAWADMAQSLGIRVQLLENQGPTPADIDQLTRCLRDDVDRRIKAVLTVQTDTATSTCNDIKTMGAALRACEHPALLIVDAIASFACEPMYIDEWGVDMLITASQKGLMTPPGIALLFVGKRCWALHKEASLNTPYWDIEPRLRPSMFPERFCGTPPTHHLYGLREAVSMLLEEGIENVWRRHEALARLVWRTVDAWSVNSDLCCNVSTEEHRSLAVTTIRTASGDAPRIRQWCEEKLGVVLGVGLGGGISEPPQDNLFRIGHMGHLNPAMLFGTLACVDTALKALEVPHGPHALSIATQELSEAL